MKSKSKALGDWERVRDKEARCGKRFRKAGVPSKVLELTEQSPTHVPCATLSLECSGIPKGVEWVL